MTITRVGSPAYSQTFGSPLTPARSQVPTPGNLLLVSINGPSGAPTGWVQQVADSIWGVFRRIADGGAADNPAFSWSSSRGGAAIWEEYAGVDAANPIHATGAISTSLPAVVPVTVSRADALIWSAGSVRDAPFNNFGYWDGGATMSGGFSATASAGQYMAFSTATLQATGTGTYSPTWYGTGNSLPRSASIALNPVAGPEYRTQDGLVIPTTQAGPVSLVSQ